MIFGLVSDLHIEFSKKKFLIGDHIDVLLVAGDTAPGVQGLFYLREIFPKKPIVTIAGNHEFYGSGYSRAVPDHYKKLKDKADELDIFFLQDETIDINGVRIIGSTLWTDYNLMGNQPIAMLAARQSMNDFRQIRSYKNAKITPEFILDQHTKSVNFICSELQKEIDQPTIVITHHAPCELSVDPNHKGDILNACYASDLTGLILDHGPDVWCNGHIHHETDYFIGRTNVVSNPYGYDQRKDFKVKEIEI